MSRTIRSSQPTPPAAAAPIALKDCLGDASLSVMNFLNEVVLRYPSAVSFAPGRPFEEHFDVEGSLARAAVYVDYRAAATGLARGAVFADLGQYNKTNGIINDLVARQLAADEGIVADPSDIIVTCGCQEGMAVLLLGLFDPAVDVLLSSDPTYIGITGLAKIMGIGVQPIASGENGLEPEAVVAAARAIRATGKRPRAIYDIPDFNNPLGTRMPLAARHALLAAARAEGLLIFEDNPYGMFAYDGPPAPTLKSLEERADGIVIYMGSYSKTLFPGLRIGYLVCGQQAVPSGVARGGAPVSLAEELSKVKSLTTVTTPPLLQAIVGGLLLENGGSLAPLMAAKLPAYRASRDRMLAALDASFGADSELAGAVTWNRPEGGFFLTLNVPFDFTPERLTACARDYGVIVCPMTYFAIDPQASGRERQVRLSFSYVAGERIDEGIRRLARFVRDVQGSAAVLPTPPPRRRASSLAGSR